MRARAKDEGNITVMRIKGQSAYLCAPEGAGLVVWPNCSQSLLREIVQNPEESTRTGRENMNGKYSSELSSFNHFASVALIV